MDPESPLCPKCSRPLSSPAAPCRSCAPEPASAPQPTEPTNGDAPVEHETYDIAAHPPQLDALLGDSVRLEESEDEVPPEEVPARFAAEEETEEAPPPADPLRRWPAVVAGLLVTVVAAAILILRSASRSHEPPPPDGGPFDAYALHEQMYERFLGSAALAPVAIAEAFDPNESIEREGQSVPVALAAARRSHQAFARVEGMTLHQFFDAFLDRYLQISPESSFHLGIHPHPLQFGNDDEADRLRFLMLVRDASEALHAWPEVESLSPHDRTDRKALLGWLDFQLRWHRNRDSSLLTSMGTCFYALTHLAEVPCCPAGDRVAAACAYLEALPACLRREVSMLTRPSHALVLATARELDDAAEDLARYDEEFYGATHALRGRLRDAVAPVREAARECAQRLRAEVLPHADGPLGFGPENVALFLRVRHRLPLDAADAYRRELDELRVAHEEMRRLAPSSKAVPHLEPSTDEQVLSQLRDETRDWMPTPPLSDRLEVLPLKKYAEDRGAGASYADAGALGPSDRGVIHVHAAPPKGEGSLAAWQALKRRHMLAHEAYPGHRLDALYERRACALRRFIDDRCRIEGWAVYAVDLLHETGHCAGGPSDSLARATECRDQAERAMVALLIQTGAASEEQVLRLLRSVLARSVDVVEVGQRASRGLYSLDYPIGRDEIHRLRRSEESRLGAAFDLKAFHARLLSEGPIPIPLIEEEWQAERE